MAALRSRTDRCHGGGVPRSGLIKSALARAAGGTLACSCCALPARPVTSVLIRDRSCCERCLRAYMKNILNQCSLHLRAKAECYMRNS